MRSFMKLAVFVCQVVLLVFVATAWSDVTVPGVIGSNMVLQRDIPIPIWGWAEPGEAVTVKIADNEASTKADEKGNWIVKLQPMSAGGPHEMTISGKNTLKLTDVLIGEVWVCSGQSNMGFGIGKVDNAEQEVAAANYPSIRLLRLGTRTSGYPETAIPESWQPCAPNTVVDDKTSFSGVAYFFGRELYKNLNVPIGLIESAWGGTRIEPWTAPEGFASVPKYADVTEMIAKSTPEFEAQVKKTLPALEKWLVEAREALAAGKHVPKQPDLPTHPISNRSVATGIYNAMIYPLLPFGIRGVIWYQGEANQMEGLEYTDRMKALINGWRKVWGQGDFPFYFVQLAPYAYPPPETLPMTWEAQRRVLSVVPNTGMVVTTDLVTDLKDIHPTNKQDVGKRLALWALAKDYGKTDLEYSGPLYKSFSVEGKRIRIKFNHAKGLKSRDGKPLAAFLISGADGKFVPAKAKVDKNSILVWARGVSEPAAVRFAWGYDTKPNLVNAADLPASPFRTEE